MTGFFSRGRGATVGAQSRTLAQLAAPADDRPLSWTVFRSPRRSLMLLLVSVPAFLGVAACGKAEPDRPKAGDVVRPVRAGAMSSGTPGKTSVVSVYEYSDRNKYIITGKRIRFRIDHSLVSLSYRTAGPVNGLMLLYDVRTLGPLDGPSAQPVSALLLQRQVGGNLSPDNIAESNFSFGTIGELPVGSLQPRKEPVCDLDAYDVTAVGSREVLIQAYDPHPMGQRFADIYGGSMVFAVRDSGGRYSDIISCSRRFPTCEAASSYRGWPVRIVFSNERVCEYPTILLGVRSLFERFYVDETDRSLGQVERRWHPAEIRGEES